MRKMLLSVCVALAVLGCGGDDDDLPECLDLWCMRVYDICGDKAYNDSTEFCSCPDGTCMVYPKCGGKDYNPSTEFCSENSVYPAFACTMTAATGTVGVPISPAPAATCKGSTVTAGLAWTPANLIPTTVGSISVSVSASSGACSGMTAQCGTFFSVPIVACTVSAVSNGSVTCGGQTYKTVVIGTQTWFAENLNYAVEGSKCYNYNPARCDIYGSLYNWATAMNLPSSCNSSYCSGYIQSKHQGICPSGWHIPSDAEWDILKDYVGSSTSGTKLKATSGWDNSGNGTDDYGFSALPGGYGFSDGSFGSVGNFGRWWSASENYGSYAYYMYMLYSLSYVYKSNYGKSYLYSVRCLQD